MVFVENEKIVGVACLVAKLICFKSCLLFLNAQNIESGRELFKSHQTWHGLYPVYAECKAERNFALALGGRKLVFHSEICEFCEYPILKTDLLHRVKELFKSGQTYDKTPVVLVE